MSGVGEVSVEFQMSSKATESTGTSFHMVVHTGVGLEV